MDLTQSKLTKSEWMNVEIPVSDNEKVILKLINDGCEDVNIRINKNLSLFQMMKIDFSEENEAHLFKEYFEKEIQEIIKKFDSKKIIKFNTKTLSSKKPKKADIIRMQNLNDNIVSKKMIIFEYTLIDLCQNIMKSFFEKTTDYAFSLYTIIQITKSSIPNINKYVFQFVTQVIDYANSYTSVNQVISKSYEFIEKNHYLLKYEDMTLFPHQKQLFTIFKQKQNQEYEIPTPKLVLYIAPTGTGKTLSPIGLSSNHRIIFICVARHVGLALAKAAISMNKKIAFAFGCETASDIRLHYFAASTYTIKKKSGGIGKVDNSIGNKVEIMICDVRSYLTAMHYMLAFNPEQDIITYWDEPTITMDYPEHDLHETIHRNWKENIISKMVLSCATLPNEMEIQDTILDFRSKFDGAEIHTISSYDCKKSIAILNKEGFCVLPHLIYSDYNKLLECGVHCTENKTMLRYFDLKEIIRFIEYVNATNLLDEDYKINQYFANISDITMNSLKLYYLETLKHIDPTQWSNIHKYLKVTQIKKFPDNYKKASGSELRRIQSMQQEYTPIKNSGVNNTNSFTKSSSFDNTSMSVPIKPINPTSGILLTTSDAHTLTDGPTIFLAQDVEKIAKFYIHNSNIPDIVFKKIMEKISANNELQKRMEKLSKTIEDKLGDGKDDDGKSDKKSDKKNDRKEEKDPEIRRLSNELDQLRENITSVNLDPNYIPNSGKHQEIWTDKPIKNAFSSIISEDIVKDIMEVDVEDPMKILLLLGIGMFTNNPNVQYMEIMKKLAYEQKLYIIIASSDYIYGTNYSFCHGFIGKDLVNMTQQKIIQSMGRIGRNSIQQEYTVRFRDDDILMRLFDPVTENLEAINMSKLFNSD